MKTKLISLVALAMADFAFLAANVPADAEFEVEADDAEALLTNGRAKLAEPPLAGKKPSKTVKARVLVNCAYGEPNDLADIDADEAKAAESHGWIDTDKAAVAYAAKEAKAAKAAAADDKDEG